VCGYRVQRVPSRTGASQDALEGVPKHRCDDVSGTRVMGLIRSSHRETHTPERPMEPIVSPSRVIGVHCWTRTERCLEIGEHAC